MTAINFVVRKRHSAAKLLIALFKLLFEGTEGKDWYESTESKVWYKGLGILHMAHHAKSTCTDLNCDMMHLFSFVMKLSFYLFYISVLFSHCILCNSSLKDMNSDFWTHVLQVHIQSKKGL